MDSNLINFLFVLNEKMMENDAKLILKQWNELIFHSKNIVEIIEFLHWNTLDEEFDLQMNVIVQLMNDVEMEEILN